MRIKTNCNLEHSGKGQRQMELILLMSLTRNLTGQKMILYYNFINMKNRRLRDTMTVTKLRHFTKNYCDTTR